MKSFKISNLAMKILFSSEKTRKLINGRVLTKVWCAVTEFFFEKK